MKNKYWKPSADEPLIDFLKGETREETDLNIQLFCENPNLYTAYTEEEIKDMQEHPENWISVDFKSEENIPLIGR